jgi:hypothetical protein
MNKKTFKRLFIENLSGKIETSKDKKISNLQNKMRKNWKICQKKIFEWEIFLLFQLKVTCFSENVFLVNL